MIINKFREWVNLGLYDSKVAVLKTFDILKLLGVFVAGGIILYTLGYPLNDDDRLYYISFIYYLLFFYALNYFIRFLYTFEPRKFIKHTAIELGLIIIVVAQGLSALFLEASLIEHICHDLLYFEHPIKAMMVTLEIILVMILFLDFSKLSSLVSLLKIDTVWIFIISFIIIIGIGTILLMLPEMSHTPNGASFMKALFTSTSASCVTGLIVCDTATFWTFKGQVVIIVLVQLGGVSILTFATFFATFFAKGMGVKEQSMLQDFFTTDSKSDAREILRSIVFLSIMIEAVGAFFIYHSFGSQIQFPSTSHKIYQSIFHSISAFNNSGFSIITDGLYNPSLRHQYILHFTMVALVFLGAIGFPALQEFFYPRKIRDRMRFGWKKMNVAARISIYTAVGITLVTAILTYLLERNHYLQGESALSSISMVLYQAVDRTAGFNTMDTGQLRVPTLMLFCVTMFIGSGSASTGGGLRTSTFAVLFLAGFAILRGKRRVEVFKNTIPQEMISKAFTLFLFTIVFEVIMLFLLTITDPEQDLINLIFEVVSALGTMGRSTGITSELSPIGTYLIIACMFIGRVSTISLLAAISEKGAGARYKYPPAEFMIG